MAAALTDFLVGDKADWYEIERNTAVLLKAVFASLDRSRLSGDDLWSLARLTWITNSGSDPAPDHWMGLKVPALGALFRRKAIVSADLPRTLEGMQLPRAVADAAIQTTGIVNFRNVWRNSSRNWCIAHTDTLLDLFQQAARLPTNDQARFDLAAKIAELPSIASPSEGNAVTAAAFVTPVIACLDPSERFPIINGREGVQKLLRSRGLSHDGLGQQVKGLVNLVGQFGIRDSFMIDTLADEIVSLRLTLPTEPAIKPMVEGSELPYLDDAERIAIQKSGEMAYRARHNTMTNRVRLLLSSYQLMQGANPNCRYDVLVKNYDGKSRDLLIEVKPDPDRGAIRIAIGQLLDYRRSLPNRTGTDLALLTISAPDIDYIDLLLDLQITSIWFTDEHCTRLDGIGKVWSSVRDALKV